MVHGEEGLGYANVEFIDGLTAFSLSCMHAELVYKGWLVVLRLCVFWLMAS